MPPEELDQDAVRLAKAIRYTESRDNENAKGKSGEFGLYQFMPQTWASTTAKYKLDPNDRSRQNQNKAAYLQIKELKDQGYKPDQIAAFWNSGKTEGWENMRGTNKYGARYDVPDYVNKVGSVYKGLKTNDVPKVVNTASTVEPPDNRDLLQKTGDVVNTIFPGKQIGQSIGTLGAYGFEKLKGVFGGQDNSQYMDLSAPTPLQTVGDAAQIALTVGAGVPGAAPVKAFGATLPSVGLAGSAMGRIGQGAAVGAGFGLSGSVARGNTDVGTLAKDTAIGGAVGGTLTGAAEGVSAMARNLPKWFIKNHIPHLRNNPEAVEYTLKTKKLGDPVKMLTQSDDELTRVGQELSKVIKNPKGSYVQPTGDQILTKVAESFDNAGLDASDVAEQLKKIAPLHRKLVDKLVSGQTMTIDELWTLDKAIGPKIFKGTPFDAPEVRAGKDVANRVWHLINDLIKDSVPESVPLFEAYRNEVALNAALNKLTSKPGRPLIGTSLYDLLVLIGGHTVGGLPGALVGLGAQRALTSPSVNLGTAGLISKLPQTGAGPVLGPVKGLLTRGVGNAVGQ